MNNTSMLRSLVAIAFLAFGGTAAVAADAPPLRHLVYSFTYSSRQQGAVPNEPGSSGAQTYTGTLDDKGTITVDVMREAQDRGLVVVVSEQGEHTRSAAPVTCAVYGTTDVACDQGKQVNREEYTLLRFLGVNFVDLSRIDEKQHWQITSTKGNVTMTADYTIKSNDNGVLSIGETRHIEDKSQGGTTNANGAYFTAPGTSIDNYKGAALSFINGFKKAYNIKDVQPYAILAAQAAEVLVGGSGVADGGAIGGSDGSRSQVINHVFASHVNNGLIGSFSFNKNGDITGATGAALDYTVYLGKGSNLTTVATVVPVSSLVQAARRAGATASH